MRACRPPRESSFHRGRALGGISGIPQVLDSPGRYPGVGHRGVQNLAEELSIPHVVLLVDPEGLENVVGVLLLGRIPLAGPLLAGRNHVLGVTLTELDPGPVANSIHRRLVES